MRRLGGRRTSGRVKLGLVDAPGSASLAAGRRLDQLDVGDGGDRADDVLVSSSRREAQRQLDLVAALADPLTVDPGHLDAPVGEQPGDVPERLEPADLEPYANDLEA